MTTGAARTSAVGMARPQRRPPALESIYIYAPPTKTYLRLADVLPISLLSCSMLYSNLSCVAFIYDKVRLHWYFLFNSYVYIRVWEMYLVRLLLIM